MNAGPGAGFPGGDSGAVTLQEAGRTRRRLPVRPPGARAAATAAALAATLGLAAVCWMVAVRQMNGMDMRLPPGVVRSGYLQAYGWR